MSDLFFRSPVQANLAQERVVEVLTAATAAMSGVLVLLMVAAAS